MDRRAGLDYSELLSKYAALPCTDPARAGLREQLIVGLLPVAQGIARRFLGKGEARDDLEQVAAVGLLRALDRFDPALGTDFLSYAVPTITGELRHYFRDASWVVRFPRSMKDRHLAILAASSTLSATLGRAPTTTELAEHLAISRAAVNEVLATGVSCRPISLDQSLGGDDDPAHGKVMGVSGEGFDNVEARVLLRGLVASLPTRERTILVMRFIHYHTQSEIAVALHISQNHVSRVLAATLARLREQAQAAGLASP